MVKLGAVLTAAVVVLAGCGGGGQPSSTPVKSKNAGQGTAEAAVTTTAVEAADPSPSAEADGSGRMIVTYDDATTPEAIRGRALMEKTKVMDGLAQDVNESLKLPYDVPLVGQQCGEANDFWDPSEKKMILCYEDVDNSLQIFGDAHDADPNDAARRVVIASFYHELGHMVIDLYDLPATGREEDVADQLSAFVLLQPDDQGNANPDYVEAAKDQARAYQIAAKEDDAASDDLLADPHTLNQARMYNFECWIYGSNPDANADIVADGMLPEARADGCEDEYNKLSRAWSTLLEPHMK